MERQKLKGETGNKKRTLYSALLFCLQRIKTTIMISARPANMSTKPHHGTTSPTVGGIAILFYFTSDLIGFLFLVFGGYHSASSFRSD